MTIGILTFHNAHNYGAVLQAFALREALRKRGHNTEIINYRNAKIESSYETILPMPKEKYSLRHLRGNWILFQKRKAIKFAQRDWAKQCIKFSEFINHVLLENNPNTIRPEKINEKNYDLIIFGSDQIWTEWLTGGYDPVFFGNFQTKAKKVSYAASRFNANFNSMEIDYFASNLKDFRLISVREQELANSLSEICQREISVVLDPTLLINKDDYRVLEKEIEEKSPYILAYFLYEDSNLMECALAISAEMKLPLVEIHYYKQIKLGKHKQVADCGPGEFLTYIRNAEFILTNSYHGLIFSTIYKKNFYCVYDKDSRKDNLLLSLGLKDRHIKTKVEINLKNRIDYDIVNENLQKEVLHSTKYLETAVDIV